MYFTNLQVNLKNYTVIFAKKFKIQLLFKPATHRSVSIYQEGHKPSNLVDEFKKHLFRSIDVFL